ncbi:hypothetical protein RQP46_006646 [Phenoliferia psychrophenolica]
MSLRSTGLAPGPTKEERRVLHAGVSSDLRPIYTKVLAFLLCISLLPYLTHSLVKSYLTLPSMLPESEQPKSFIPTVAAGVVANLVIVAFLGAAAMGDRKEVAEQLKNEVKGRKEK